LIGSHADVALGKPTLDGDRTADSVDDAAELRENSISGRLHHAAPMLCDQGNDQGTHVSLKGAESASLVQFHESAVADYIGGKDRGQAALGEPFGHFLRRPPQKHGTEIIMRPAPAVHLTENGVQSRKAETSASGQCRRFKFARHASALPEGA